MGSKSTHQFPTLSSLEPTDLFYVVREESPGVFKDYSAPRSLLPDSTDVAIVLLTSAQILAIHDTPIELVPDPGSSSIIIVQLVTMSAIGGTTAYDLGFLIGGATVNAANNLLSGIFPDNDTPIPYRIFYPANAGSSVNQGIAPGQSIRISSDAVNPEDGDGDVLVKVYYSTIPA